MSVIAKLHYLRIAPRKVRLVADLIRGKTVEEAQTILNFIVKKAAQPLLKLLKSAIANAKHNFQLKQDNLYISKIMVDEGPKYKRWMPRARGMVSPIQKKTSHITIVLEEIKKKGIRKIKKIKKTKEIKKIQEEIKIEKPKLRAELETIKPRIKTGIIRRIFRRKAF